MISYSEYNDITKWGIVVKFGNLWEDSNTNIFSNL